MFKSKPVISSAKLGTMVADLRAIRTQLLPDLEGQALEKEMENFDAFQRQKFKLNRLLGEIRADCIKLDQLRQMQDEAKGVSQRSPEIIRIQTSNSKRLKDARDQWQELQKLLVKDTKTKKNGLDPQELQTRRQALEQLGGELQLLARKNATVKGAPAVSMNLSMMDGDTPEARRAKRAAGRVADRDRRRRGGDDDFEAQMDASRPVSQQEQQFYDQVELNLQEQDELLDEILKGMIELKELGEDMNRNLKLQGEMLKEVDGRMDETIAEFKTANASLQDILEKSGGMSRWCPILMCVIILLALVGYLINSTR